ncbi:MAG TPA: peptidoglycan-binding protein [Gammaproteobacteria bacterium]|nr:peptidoglycan-binding protein [Gammaproteobacteria bacterium]
MITANSIKLLSATTFTVVLSGCLSTMPTLGGGSGGTVTGAAAGARSVNQNSQLESCDKTLGTVTVFEDQSLPWWNYYHQHYRHLGSTVPVIRMMIQQSNCFAIVERGAVMKVMQRERQLMSSGDLRGNSNFGKGQMAAADYTLSPSVNFRESTMGRVSGAAMRFLPGAKLLGGGSVGAKSNEAETTLLLIDNRSGVQVSSSIGSAKNFDFNFSGFSVGARGWGSASGYANSAEGKVIIAAFADSFNQMVQALRHYTPQRVAGGLGAGGALAVDGAQDAVVAANPAPAPAATQTVASRSTVHVTSDRSMNVSVSAYDGAALDNYYRALKKAVENLSKYASMTPQQIDMINQRTGMRIDLWTLLWAPSFAGDFETSKIELESWPLNAKQQGWDILGRKINRYNKLFYKNRDLILSHEGLPENIKTRLQGIELVTEESLFASN